MDLPKLRKVLERYQKGSLSFSEVANFLKWYPFLTDKDVTLDTQRKLRRGFPEIIYASGKDSSSLLRIIKNSKSISPLIISRLSYSTYLTLKKKVPSLKYNRKALIGYLSSPPKKKVGNVAVISAGNSDINVAEEAAFTLELLGNQVKRFYDLGIAGLHRIVDKIEKIEESRCAIVVAGMEGTLPSIVASLISKPVIALPTSVGYGTNFKGLSALLTMLNSCSLGLAVVNIDNGIGAATIAHLINRL